ncbi:MAG: hypothetical protein AB1758_33560, partial [Candidatus Eremiobacterota bacterium]
MPELPGPAPAVVRAQHPLADIDRPPGSQGTYRYLPPRPVCAADGSLYVGTNRGELLRFDPQGGPSWTLPLGGASPYNEPNP